MNTEKGSTILMQLIAETQALSIDYFSLNCCQEQAASKVEVNYEDAKKMQVTRYDFDMAMLNDIKPVSIL